ncbi:MAG: TetR/AcrR family transcriptional regulator [Sandaracinaceae bacterium]|nr:TetR/AcrR family transcriptional regulator [Sandaracinaceae bacterium]
MSVVVGVPAEAGHPSAAMPVNPTELGELPLRERKFARTKVALLESAMRRVREGRRLDTISVKEICAEAQVSEATFFNYFPKKSDLLLYYVQLWTVEAGARTAALSGLRAIEAIFAFTGERLGTQPTVLLELIVTLASDEGPLEFPDVSVAERAEAFPDLPGALDAEVRINVSSLFRQHLLQAVASGELPAHTEVELAVRTLGALFFGMPMVSHCSGLSVPADQLWAAQLRLLWAGLRAL